MDASRVNEMIQDLCATPEGTARLRANPDAVFAEYGLSAVQQSALHSGDTLKMVAEARVHPILAFHYLFAVRPEVMESMSLAGYPELLGSDR
jgi:hypothetical protein